MTSESDRRSRRAFMTDIGWLASAAAVTACVNSPQQSLARPRGRPSEPGDEWDMSWIDQLVTATDRAVFDWPSLGDASDPIVMEIAARYLDNCETAYRRQKYESRAVLNIRSQAVSAALNDSLWERYGACPGFS